MREWLKRDERRLIKEMVIKKDNNQLWTFVGIAVVVAVIASILTVTVTGNVIKQNNNPLGKYKVYTVDDVDKKLNNVPTYQGVLEMLSKCEGSGQFHLSEGGNWQSINGKEACDSRTCIIGAADKVYPGTNYANYDGSSNFVSCTDEVIVPQSVDWVKGSKIVVEYLCCDANTPIIIEPKVQACTSNNDCRSPGSLCNIQTKTCYSTGGSSGGSGPKAFNLQNGEATTTVIEKDSYDIRILSILSSTSTNVCVKINTGNEKCYRNLNTGESMALDNGAKLNVVNIVYSARVGAVNYVQLSLQGPK